MHIEALRALSDYSMRNSVNKYYVATQKKLFMSTYRQIFYQIVFGTKYRKPTIAREHDEELYKYIAGIIKNKNCKLYRVNGIEDPIYIMSDLHPSVCLSDYVKDIKVASSLWMKNAENSQNLKDGKMDMEHLLIQLEKRI